MSCWSIALCTIVVASGAAAGSSASDNRALKINSVSSLSASVPRYGKAEFTINLQGTYANAFDPEEIAVDGEFLAPDGKRVTVPAFYFQDYTRQTTDNRERLTPSGNPQWRLRFAPTQVGRYSLRVVARDKSGSRAASKPIVFECVASSDPGFVRRSPDDRRYFQFDSGKAYVPIGANVCWAGSRGTLDYDDWLPRYSQADCNYFRVWLGPGWTTFGLEHTGEGFGLARFDQEKAWKLDYVLGLARKHGLYVMLCMDSYNELRRNSEGGYGCWDDTPHNAARGGPLATPGEFWSNPTMLRLYRNKLRYLVARWGWDTHVLSWEFWNEVDIVSHDAFNADQVAKWHAEMSDYLRGIDVNKHLQTTSFASPPGVAAIDRLPQMDYVQTHAYGLQDGAAELVAFQKMKQGYGKPCYVGEFGADAGGSDSKVDPNGILLHNGIWGTLMTGSAGSAMLWWWDNHIHPGNLYYHFAALSRFVKGIDFPRESFEVIENASFAFKEHSVELPFVDLTLSGPRAWTPSEENKPTTVRISTDGRVVVEGKVAGILHGVVNHRDLHNPLTFDLRLPHPTRITIKVSGVSGYGGAYLRAVLDGITVLDKPMPDINPPGKHDTLQTYDGDYSIDVPAGSHLVKIENIGTDWILVSYVVERAERKDSPDLRLYGVRGKTVSLIWIQNSMHNYSRIHATGRQPDPVPETVLTLQGWPAGKYQVAFWDTYEGAEIDRRTVTAASSLRIELPVIQKDIALKLTREKTDSRMRRSQP